MTVDACRDAIVRRVAMRGHVRGKLLYAWMRAELDLTLSQGQRDLRELVRQGRIERTHGTDREAMFSLGPNWADWCDVCAVPPYEVALGRPAESFMIQQNCTPAVWAGGVE